MTHWLITQSGVALATSPDPWSALIILCSESAVALCLSDHERNAATHALMSLLSMASVTFSDPAGESNKTLLMQLCREDGVLLKPDRPATAIDAQFQAMMFHAWPGEAPARCLDGSDAADLPNIRSGAVRLSDAEIETRTNHLFPGGAGGLSAGRRKAYAVSAALVEQIEARRASLQRCDGKVGGGSPQSPTGEVYSTHASVGGMTWRYVVSVQVAAPFNVTAQSLGIESQQQATSRAQSVTDVADAPRHVVYEYSESRMWRFGSAHSIMHFDGGLLSIGALISTARLVPRLTTCPRLAL